MKNDRREIFHMRYQYKVTGFHGLINYQFDSPNIIDIFKLIEAAHKSGTLKPKAYDKQKEKYYIHKLDLDLSNSLVKMIIARSDENAASPIFTDLKNRTRVKRPLKKGEGLDYSAHVFLRLDTNVMLYENVTNFNSTRLESFFKSLFRQIKSLNKSLFETVHPTEDKKVKTQTRFSLRGIVSDSLKQDIEDGTLKGITFIKEEKKGSTDNHYFESKETSLNVTPKIQGKGTFAAMENLFSSKKGLFETAKIALKTKAGQNATSTIRLNDSSLDSADATYFKKNPINKISPLLDTSHEDFHPKISAVMNSEIKKY